VLIGSPASIPIGIHIGCTGSPPLFPACIPGIAASLTIGIRAYLLSAHKPVADAGLSQDVLRPGWIILNFFPDMAHIDTDVVAIFGMGWPPYSL